VSKILEVIMNVLILDGRTENSPMATKVTSSLEKNLAGHKVDWIKLSEKQIRPCTGCFQCWIKTPGLCVINDEANSITRKIVNCDLMILLTPVTFGGYSSELKKMLDRSIPILLPYFRTYKGEVHHYMRYEKQPSNLTIGFQEETDERSAEIFMTLAERNALNMNPSSHTCVVINGNVDADKVVSEKLSEVTR
jgi:multimeric flavodoxin WrbA